MLERTFYAGWKAPNDEKYANFNTIEIILNYKCNLACKYCYVNRYGDDLYDSKLYADEDAIIKNVHILFDFIKENKYTPNFEYFSGEALVQEIGLKVLDLIIDRMIDADIHTLLLVPTNYTWILDDDKTAKVEAMLAKAKANNIHMALSASFDGKYCDANRPYLGSVIDSSHDKNGLWKWTYDENFKDPRNDEYYEKCFAFIKKHKFGFHPMIYSDHIEKWKDNFLWFQEMIKKYDLDWFRIYLLEIRNAEWTVEQCNHLTEFVQWLIEWSFEQCDRDYNKFFDFLYNKRGFNMLVSLLTTTGRGIGCSLQSQMYIRMGDLSIAPCHRTSYEHLMYGKFKVENDKIVGVHVTNPELWISVLSLDGDSLPYCEDCLIRELCTHGCMGAQYETTGDMFTPIPSMCRMEYAKIKGMIQGYEKIGVMEGILGKLSPSKRNALITLRDLIGEKNE